MNNYIKLSHCKDLTAQCAEMRQYNVCHRMCWFIGHRERTFRVLRDQPAWPNILPRFSRIWFLDFKQTFNNEDFKQTIYYLKKNNTPPIDIEHLVTSSYLSAPNFLNSCNKHVVTVFHILTDLFDMDWQQSRTAFYNLTTHSLVKIVEPLNLKNGINMKLNRKTKNTGTNWLVCLCWPTW
jgi:hypothetical protein